MFSSYRNQSIDLHCKKKEYNKIVLFSTNAFNFLNNDVLHKYFSKFFSELELTYFYFLDFQNTFF